MCKYKGIHIYLHVIDRESDTCLKQFQRFIQED